MNPNWSAESLRGLVIENDAVTLRALRADDRPGLAKIAFDPDIWTYFVATVTDEKSLDTFIEQAVADTASGTRIVFAIVDKKTGEIAGSTAFGNLAPRDLRLEIGWSWLGERYRGSGLNNAVKGALLAYAFGTLDCERVEFKTDVLNTRARRGLANIGAVEEGVLRSFNFMPSGRRRDAIYYSVLKAEWPTVRAERFNG